MRVVVGMSGGVDSSVTAAMLVESGYEVTGVYVEAVNVPGCRADQDKRDALRVATKLGIKFETLDLQKEYKTRVIDYFLAEYKAGRTPNPDVVCNFEIKFGLLLDWVRERGYSKLATGHYCRTVCENSKSKILNSKSKNVKQKSYLKRARDEGKDQSYFLWRVSSEKLKHVMFPLGEMTKEEVREKARELRLPNAEKPDSMGVCMMGKLNVREFLREKLGEKPGEVIMNGQVVGEHKGLWFLTIGQRVGSEISLQGRTLQVMGMERTRMPALYVVGKEREKNRVIIGEKREGYVDKFQISNFKFQIGNKEMQEMVKQEKLYVRIRNLGELVKISKIKDKNKIMEIETKEKIWGVAEGQSGVLYSKEGVVVGGGVIVV